MDNLTPEPEVESGALTMDFPDAVKEIKGGKKVRRITWPDTDYGCMDEGWLKVFTNNKLSRWLVSDGDMEAQDFVVLTELN